MNIRKNDVVKIITGAGNGKEGKVLRVFPEKNTVTVQGIHLVWKHLKRNQQYPHGARIQREAPVQISNVQLLCTNCHKPTRINYKITPDGTKMRTCKKCLQPIAEL
ncbi:MAG: 50S ribosomal protein L24 [Planctomycetota bacterium]